MPGRHFRQCTFPSIIYYVDLVLLLQFLLLFSSRVTQRLAQSVVDELFFEMWKKYEAKKGKPKPYPM